MEQKHNNEQQPIEQRPAAIAANPMLGVVLSYGLSFDAKRLEWVLLEATKYDENNKPISWTVRIGRTCMSKFTGGFAYEPMPSSRDDDFFNEYRFSTPEEAAECWSKHYA